MTEHIFVAMHVRKDADVKVMISKINKLVDELRDLGFKTDWDYFQFGDD